MEDSAQTKPGALTGKHAELKRRTAGSIFWSLMRALVEQGFGFLLFVVLARLITPREMGLFALALLFAEFGKLVASAGFPDAVIREPGLDEDLASSIFCANILLAIAVTAVVCLLATPIAIFFREPALRDLLWGVAIVIPVSAVGSVHTGRKLREFGYRSVTTRIFFASLCGGILGIAAALHGWGAWSLVVQRAATESMSTVLAWFAFRWVPRLRLDWKRTLPVIRFSTSLMLTQASWFAAVRSQDFIIGRGLSASGVGMYRLSARAIDLMVQFSVTPFVSSALPTLASLHDDPAALRGALLRYNSLEGLIVCPVFLGFAALAPEIVPLVFGSRWTEAAGIAQILCLLFLSHSLTSLAMPMFSALGRPGIILKIATLHLVVGVIFTVLAVPYGLLAVAAAYVARVYLILPIQIIVLIRFTGVRFRELLARLWPSLVAALVMSGSIFAVRPWLVHQVNGFVYVALAVVGGGLIYVAVLLLIAPRFTRELVDMVLALRRGSAPAPG